MLNADLCFGFSGLLRLRLIQVRAILSVSEIKTLILTVPLDIHIGPLLDMLLDRFSTTQLLSPCQNPLTNSNLDGFFTPGLLLGESQGQV
jgi:hypothetical protein